MNTLSDFLAAFFIEECESIHLRAFKAKGAPGVADNRPLVEVVTRRQLATDTELQNRMIGANKTRGWYFVVNAGGNTDADIIRFNAFFVESDSLPLNEQHRQLDVAPLQPSIRLETRKSVHAYWLINGECDMNAWREMQGRLIAYFNSDKSINNPSRVMRLPFFNHVGYDANVGEHQYKRSELQTFAAEKRYSVAEMQAAFPYFGMPDAEVPAYSSESASFITHEARHKELLQRITAVGTRKENGYTQARCPAHKGNGATALFLHPDGAVKMS